jgi:MFS family permease
MRLSNNLGISIGPVIGGFVATSSYTLAFYFASAGMIAYSLLMAGFGRETLPERAPATKASQPREFLGGYPAILADGQFMAFLANFTLVSSSAILIWTIMAAYAKNNFGISENVYKWIPVTNALMVVTLQQLVTRFAKRWRPLSVLAAGSLFYAIGVGSVALAGSFSSFWVCMVVMTLGEMMLAPTSSTYAANLAPAEKRGRYMSLYGLSWPVGQGIAPVFGGFLSDQVGIRAPWVCGGAAALIGMLIFLVMAKQVAAPQSTVETSPAD